MLSLIVAVAENRVIGRDGGLPWRLPADLRRFKRITMGRPLIMGRRTWESIARPLPGRTSIVVTRQTEFDPGFDEVYVADSLDDALAIATRRSPAADGMGEVFVIGGASLYEAALPQADRLYLTRVEATVLGDVLFPELDLRDWERLTSERHPADEGNEFAMTFEVYKRSAATKSRGACAKG